MTGSVAAVDLGATSGRVLLGHVSADKIELEFVSRFANRPVRTIDGLHWSILELYRDVVEGLAQAALAAPGLASIGIDSWGCDYGLLRGGRLLGAPYSHRDERNLAAVDEVHRIVPPAMLYQHNGLQHLPFNTVFQWYADLTDGALEGVDGFLLVPDLLAYWLTGQASTERTNASTTGMLNASTSQWDLDLASRLGLPLAMFGPLVDPGTSLGGLNATARRGVGSSAAQVTTVGSHDTASAIVAIPATCEDYAYVSCGTWSLVGLELEHPVLTKASRVAGFTNELGVDGRIRYLHNVMGLWLQSECVRDWERDGSTIDLPALVAQAAEVTEPVATFDADDRTFLAPGDMVSRIEAWLLEHDRPVPTSRAAMIRCINLSLAEAYAKTIASAAELAGRSPKVVHLVGGGSQNTLLCQLTADATGLPVLAGPVEATALGNVLVQARSLGWINGDLEALRALVVRDFDVIRYEPSRNSIPVQEHTS